MTRLSETAPILAALAAFAIVAILAGVNAATTTSAAPPVAPLAVEARGELAINGQRAPNVAPIMVAENVVPGWSGSADVDVANVGNAGGTLRFSVQNVVNEDFDCADSETSCEGGQLGASLVISLREGADKVWSGPASVEAMAAAGWADLGALSAGASRPFQLVAELPRSVGNEAMSDRVSFDIVFSLEGAPEATPTAPPGPPPPPTSTPTPAPSPPETPFVQVLAPPPPTPPAAPTSGLIQVLAPVLPRAGGPALATLGLALFPIGLALLLIGLTGRRATR